ncbi:2-oxoacid:acceptor oxidoreductase family protein [Geothermobacter hydrogeniphilus]|uniref:2-oxoacid:ferredoxin oxidoreductase subunit gamma n=1 Tax=Geothermobacter hydrogeniphilus TaxID=1969733 RepID=A0A1X0Y413_9BACT|nr:2-oxoacid:acceptor oxidoreductase family protein [Geothermobacter hydrogeniphilus]ORJ59827.1 2-oxoacid:ferredoxin oxidoreductase subunit gamma [Geothermobacter hydrogeniphilus]
MTYDVFMAGFGGQGVLMMGDLLARAAIFEGKNVSYYPSYGVEKRGGAATCTIVISDQEVGSPVIGRPGAAIILNQLSCDKYLEKVRPGGFCLLNSSLIDLPANPRDDINLVSAPLTEIARETGGDRLLNMVSLGAYVTATGAVDAASLEKALEQALPERNHRFIPMNIEAIKRGAALVKQ